MLEEFERRRDVALVLRPHPLFFSVIEERGIMTKAEIAQFEARCQASGNILIDRNPTYQALFARADAMMSDASSFVLEFCGTGKPLLYLHNPFSPDLNEDGEFVRNYLHQAESESGIRDFIDMVAAGRDPQGAARKEAYPRYMYQPAEGVGQAVKSAVEARLVTECSHVNQSELVAT